MSRDPDAFAFTKAAKREQDLRTMRKATDIAAAEGYYNLLDWRSWKLARVARSTLSAEGQSSFWSCWCPVVCQHFLESDLEALATFGPPGDLYIALDDLQFAMLEKRSLTQKGCVCLLVGFCLEASKPRTGVCRFRTGPPVPTIKAHSFHTSNICLMAARLLCWTLTSCNHLPWNNQFTQNFLLCIYVYICIIVCIHTITDEYDVYIYTYRNLCQDVSEKKFGDFKLGCRPTLIGSSQDQKSEVRWQEALDQIWWLFETEHAGHGTIA